MLAAWSWFGIETDATLRIVLAIAASLACTMFVVSFAAAPLERLTRSRTAGWLVSERDHFFVAYAIALAWYTFFALAGRVTVVPSHSVSLPLPLAVVTMCGILTSTLLLFRSRALVSGRDLFTRFRPPTHVAVAVLLVAGFSLG
jgi:hypothetical protein